MENFKILNNIEDSILVVDRKNQVLFQNIASTKQFGNFANINRFKKYFNIDICILNPEEIANITPLDLLLSSEENFYTYATYQKSKDDYLHLNIYALVRKNYKIIIFKDVTVNTKYQKTLDKYDILNTKYTALSKENKKFIQLKEKAQDQAVKMSLLNRVSSIIRESTDISAIRKSTLEEIHKLLGSYKTYYAVKSGTNFKIKDITPNKYNNYIGLNLCFEDETLKLIKAKKITMSACIKEHKNSEETLSKSTKRIIIPIFHKNKPLGIIVTLTTQKDILKDNIDILESISTQLSSSIIQTSLFEQINKKNIKLQKTLNELNSTQLQLINAEKMASVGQLVAGVAHEINTPLASISSNSGLTKKILEKNPVLNDSLMQTLKDLNTIDQEAIKRINNIVKSLKKFVRLDEADLQEADINNEIDLTLQLLSHEIKNKVTVIKNYSKLPLIKCYVNMLNQVFMNILVNACQSIAEKNGEGKIEITTSYENENLIVSIKDNGKGMSQKIQSQIFNTGFTTKGVGIGTGLGLAISNKIIQKHKGTITFNSVENEGTEFIIQIPSKKLL